MTSDAGRNASLSPVTPALFKLPIALFGLCVLSLLLVVFYLFSSQRQVMEDATRETVSVMAQFRARAVDRWLTERRGDAWALTQQLAARDAFKAWLEHPDAGGKPAGQIRQHLATLNVYRNYRDVILTDVTGKPLLSASGRFPSIGADEATFIRRAAATLQLQISNLDMNSETGVPGEILICAPVLDRAGIDGKIVAVLMLSVDPSLDLIPSIEMWPGANHSAEIYLVAAQADGLRFINRPRHGTTLANGRIPLTKASIAAALAHGADGFIEGTDYRGVGVLAGISAVPGMPWHVVAQIDAAEVFGPIRRLAVTYSLIIVALIAAMGFLLMAAWRRREVIHLTARHQADTERLEMLQRFELLSKYANDIILLVDASGRIAEANDRALSAYGRERDELIGEKLAEIFAPSDKPSAAFDPMRPGPERNDGAIFESLHRRRDGTSFPVEISVRRMEIEGGSWQQLIVRDITDRKQSERAVRDGERLLRQISDTIDEVFWVADLATGRFTYLSTSFATVTGLDPGAMMANPRILLELMPPEDRELVARGRDEGFANGKAYSNEYRLQLPDGSLRWIWGRGFPVVEDDGTVKTFIGVAQDITERKVSEDAIHERERLLRLISDTIDEVFWIIDPDTRRVIYVNSAFQRMLGRNPDVLMQDMHAVFSFMPEEDRERVLQTLEHGFATGQPYSNEYRVMRADGSLRWIWSRGFPVVEDDGKVSAFVGVAQDITDRKEAEAKFLQAQKLETVGHLTAGVAHDFNNLLMAIQFGIEFARDSVRLGMDPQEQFDMVLDATQRGADLVRRLSVFSRQQDLDPKVVDPGHLVRQALPLIRTALPETIITEVEVNGVISPINVDAGQMENALLNLAINARDAMPDGGSLIFGVSKANAGMVEVAVADTGTGMPPEVRAKALEPFFTTKELGKGTGLGLSMVYGFVTQSGGTLEIDSEEGKGTTVRMLFPPATGSANAAVQRRATALQGGPRLGHVMLVDDEMGVRKALENLLKPLCASLVALTSGPDGISAIARIDRIDLLVSDVVLPGGISGFDLADAAMARHPACKVLLMSGYSAEAQREHGGAIAYRLLQKPFSPKSLMAELEVLGFAR
jgi:PAS domain S-box-containing protein